MQCASCNSSKSLCKVCCRGYDRHSQPRPIGQPTKVLPGQEFRSDLTQIPSETMSVQPGMAGDLTTGLMGNRSVKSGEKLKKPFEGSSF